MKNCPSDIIRLIGDDGQARWISRKEGLCDENERMTIDVYRDATVSMQGFTKLAARAQKKESGLFLTNTKAALRYYSDTDGSGYDSMYFTVTGDEIMLPMPVFFEQFVIRQVHALWNRLTLRFRQFFF